MKSCEIIKFNNQKFYAKTDLIATESVLSIEIIWGPVHNRTRTHLADLLRTPGHDFELASGLLFSLGIINLLTDISSHSFCIQQHFEPDKPARIILELDFNKLLKAQNFFSGHVRHAGCGLCTSPQELPKIKALKLATLPLINSKTLITCEKKLKPAQELFNMTGGTHAAALFDTEGQILALYEDVGRHNALDKLIGFMLKETLNPKNAVLVMSSRASYELVQKAHMAQIPLIATLGAISSQALEYAEEFNITLVGFLRDSGFNIYTHPQRIESTHE